MSEMNGRLRIELTYNDRGIRTTTLLTSAKSATP